MIKFVSGNGEIIRGRETQLSHLFISSMPESILSKLGFVVVLFYFKEVSKLESAKIALAYNDDNEIIGYVDIIAEDVFSKIIQNNPFYLGLKIIFAILMRRIGISQIISSDKSFKNKHEKKILNLPELSYIFTEKNYKGGGIGKGLMKCLAHDNIGLRFYTKTLKENVHVLKLYQATCKSVSYDFFYKDKINKYIIIYVSI